MHTTLIEQGMEMIMRGLEMDMRDPALSPTPERYRRFLQELFEDQQTEWATFEEDYTDFVLLRRHRLWTLCPHHFIPVRMDVSLAYIPQGRVLGLSKLARVCHDTNRGPVMQEKFTRDLVKRVKKITNCSNVAAFVDGLHGCMNIRGIKSDANLITYRCEGEFDSNLMMQQRFFQLVKQ